jgi:hypothetical protein
VPAPHGKAALVPPDAGDAFAELAGLDEGIV